MNGSFELPERDEETEQPEPFRVLKRGSRGPDVARIQKVLNLNPADGIYGVITSQQVLLFQRKNNLAADSIVGKMTYTKLFEMQKRPILQRWPDGVL
jgi:peptidoglycan hydrolase-like protein with peptidoglycan-binding domain